jgi:uncharacterized protein
MTARMSGLAGLRELLARCIDPRRIAASWWTLAVLFYPVLTLLAVAITSRMGLGGTIDLAGTGQRLLDPIGFVFFALFLLLMGPLPEEIGWRGYLLNRLLVRRSALAASLIVALVWWIWHLPLGYLPGYFAVFEGFP